MGCILTLNLGKKLENPFHLEIHLKNVINRNVTCCKNSFILSNCNFCKLEKQNKKPNSKKQPKTNIVWNMDQVNARADWISARGKHFIYTILYCCNLFVTQVSNIVLCAPFIETVMTSSNLYQPVRKKCYYAMICMFKIHVFLTYLSVKRLSMMLKYQFLCMYFNNSL